MVGDEGLAYFAILVRFWLTRPRVDPIGIGGILVKTVRRPEMVGHHIHDQFHAFRVQGVCVVCVRAKSSKTRVNTVVVGDGVAMIGRPRHVVFQDGHGPNRRGPQRSDEIQVGCQALEVSPMALIALAAVQTLLGQTANPVIARIPIGKTIWRDQIDKVSGIQAHVRSTAWIARLQYIGNKRRSFGLGVVDVELKGLRRCLGLNDQRNIVVMGILSRFIFENSDPLRLLQGHLLDVTKTMLNEQFYGVSRHPDPPVGRIDDHF